MPKSGKIFFGSWGVPRTVRSLSETGACLQVQTTYGMPSTFELVIADRERRTCKGHVARQHEAGHPVPVSCGQSWAYAVICAMSCARSTLP